MAGIFIVRYNDIRAEIFSSFGGRQIPSLISLHTIKGRRCGMEVHRTAPVKLVVSDEQCDALHDTRDQFLWCANRASEVCWSKYDYEECITNKCTAQAALYDELRENTDLTANLVTGAIYRAVEAVKGCVERWKKRQRVSQPEFTS